LTTAEQQITEDGPSSSINTSNLAIQNGAFNAKMFSDPCGQIGSAA
jgi:hypothetical protein